MKAHSLPRHDFWEDITSQICATIGKESVNYDSDYLDRTFAEAEREGRPIPKEPSLEQAAEDREYAKQTKLGRASEFRSNATDVTEESTTDLAATRAEAGLNFLDLITCSTQGLEDRQRIARDPEVLIRSRFTPTSLPAMTRSSSRTITPGLFPDAPTSLAREYLNGSSPTPAAATIIEDSEMASSPTTPTASTDASSPKRKLPFGMPVFGGEDQLKMPPPKLRKTSPTIEDQIFSQFMNADAVTNPSAEVTFKDIPSTSPEDPSSDKEVPKTPVLVEFGSPSSPVVIRDDNNNSYPTCLDGLFARIPLHHLRSLRKTVDPTFQDDHYWGDSLYFSEEPVHCRYFPTEASRLHSLDWRIIFHALDNDADNRIPLPDTSTKPRMSDEQLNKIWLRFKGVDQERAVFQAQMPRDWTVAQMAEAGFAWTEIRGTYGRDPPEFTTRSSQDICADRGFRLFCSLAQFVDGRPAVIPKGQALRDTLSMLRYARLPKTPRHPQTAGLVQQQMQLDPQHSIPANAALLRYNTLSFNNIIPSYPSSSPTPAAPQPLPQVSLRNPLNRNHVAAPVRNTTPLVNCAFHDIRVFAKLPDEKLLGLQLQWLQGRAQQHINQGLPVPTTIPNVHQLWEFFRHRVQTNTAARVQRDGREAGASSEVQASMLRNPLVEQPSTPISSRPVQLQSHMPGAHGHRQFNGARNMVAAATPLGSPFLTPRKRNDDIDPRLLS